MKRKLLVLLFSMAVVGHVYAQRDVSGKVTSGEDGSSLPGVNVVVVGSQQGSITDVDGNYKVSVSEDASLKFSYIGYLDYEVQVGNQSVIDVVMQEETTQLSEIVVTAFGIEKDKKSLGYAVQKVEGEEIARVKASPSAISNLKGRVAGVNITESGSGPGAGVIAVKLNHRMSLYCRLIRCFIYFPSYK